MDGVKLFVEVMTQPLPVALVILICVGLWSTRSER